jgi:magnesium transporter
MFYLSQLQSAPVEDFHGARIGKISDLLTSRDDPSQRCAFLIEGQDEQSWYVSAEGVAWRDHTLHLPLVASQLDSFLRAPFPDQVALVSEVLDKQVIDLARKKPVRVNDVCIGDDWRVLGVDNSPFGLMRRLAPPWLLGARSKYAPANFIPWKHVELISSLQEEDQTQTVLVSSNTTVIQETTGPGEVANLQAELPEAHTQELLCLVTPEESEDVQDLLEYEENSAGSLMTTNYIAINASRTVTEALEAVRAHIRDDIHAVYLYCVPNEKQDENPLLGVVSIWDLLAADPVQELHEFMETDVVAVRTDTEQHTVAEVIAKYNLLAVPVINSTGILQGVITVDDALGRLLPNTRKRKPQRMH